MKKVLSITLLLILFGVAAYFLNTKKSVTIVTNFDECVAAGNPVMESYPRQCRANGQTFVEDVEGILPYDSGVQGTVLLGPTCPVMREEDDSCADRPYATTIYIIRVGSTQSVPFATVESDESGRYSIMLPPGEYSLQAQGGDTLPRCEEKTVEILPSVISNINISCDSGIR